MTKNIPVSNQVHAMLYLLKMRMKARSYSEVIHKLINSSEFKEFSKPKIFKAFGMILEDENRIELRGGDKKN